MNPLDVASRLTTLVAAVAGMLRQAMTLVPLVRSLGYRPTAMPYENVLLELVLEIQDRGGRTAVLERRQRVRFLSETTEVVRELVWGEGSQLVRYRVRGA